MNKYNKVKSENLNLNDMNDEINISFLFNSILRNKKIISLVSIIFFIIFSFYSFSRKKIWEGQFDIVLENPDKNGNENLIPPYLRFASRLNNDLKTQVGILESPSVLMPVFEYVKSKKGLKEKDFYFSAWKSGYLNINLKKSTSILKIKYSDSDKTLIIPVLNKISKAYQEYSGKNDKRTIELQRNYLQDQIIKYKKKSNESIKIAQEYAMNENLLFDNSELFKNLLTKSPSQDSASFNLTSVKDFSGINPVKSLMELSSLNNFDNSWFGPLNNISMENIRVRSANQIKNIDLQIKKIEELGDDSKKIQFIGITIPGLVNEGLPQILREMDNELIELKTKYSDNDFSIKLLNDKRKIYTKLLKERAIQYLKAQRLSAEALMESASRPGEVMMEYKRLLRNAAMDEKTLFDLENKFRTTELSAAKRSDPWELITKPTILNNSSRTENLLFGILGAFLGAFITIIVIQYKEQKLGILYEEKQLTDIFNSDIIEKINLNNKSYGLNSREILNNEIFTKYFENNIVFVKSNQISSEDFNKFNIINFEGKERFVIQDTFDKIQDKKRVILITSLGKITKEEAHKINNRIKMVSNNIAGIILFE